MDVPPPATAGDGSPGTPSRNPALKLTAQLVLALLGVAGLYAAKAHSYLLFHAFAELFGIVISACIFVVAWNGRRLHNNHPLTLLGVAYLSIGAIDLLHMLSYRGMGVFPGMGPNPATQLWMGSRIILSVSLVLVAIMPIRRGRPILALAIYAAATGLLILSVFYWKNFPACFIDGQGLTPFKRAAEYACCGAIALAVALLWRRRHAFDRQMVVLMLWSMAASVGAGFAFTLYNDPFALWNWTGHVLKIVSYYLAYEAIVVTAMERPYAVMFRDLMANERALRRATAVAEAAGQAKDRFLAVLSHELRTPLAPVMLTISSYERDPRLPADVRQELSVARRNLELETHLIDDLLDLNRVIAGKLPLRLESVDLHRLLTEAVRHCAADAEVKRVTLTMPAADALRDTAVPGDPSRLLQVFWNLLKNAVKFSDEGGAVTIGCARTEATPPRVRITIADEGIGIEPQAMQRIFEAFEQGSQAVTQQFGGLGLGLSVARSIVTLHGGTIEVHSAGAGRGATFTVDLPCDARLAPTVEPRTPVPVPQPAVNGSPARAADGMKLSLLVVEDHVDTARALSRMLTGFGHTVKTAHTAAAARSAAEADTFDLVLSDIGLPDATGYDLMRDLRARHGLAGIAMSGYGMDEDLEKSRDAGFAAHLTKPVAIDRLVDAIEQQVAMRGL